MQDVKKKITERTRQPLFESLEDRRLLSASLLAPSAVEGNYAGNVIESSGVKVAVRLTVTSKKATLTIAGKFKLSESISASHLTQMRRGTLDLVFKIRDQSITFTGRETKSGTVISGAYDTTFKVAGTFSLTKAGSSSVGAGRVV